MTSSNNPGYQGDGDFSYLLEDAPSQGDFSYMLDWAEEDMPKPDAIIGKGRVTILHTLWGTATKTFTANSEKSYSIGKYFDVEEKPANNVHDLANILTDIQRDTKKLIIRGAPTGPQRKHVLRRSVGEDATFRDSPCHWAMLDIDSLGGRDPAAPKAELRNLLETTPQLAGTTCVCQVSSSWGLKPGVRAHMWFWLEEPRTSQQVSEWASSLPFKVDQGLFNPVQPHYTANPVFDGRADPLVGQDRVFVIRGNSDALYIPAGTAQAELDHWVDAIQNLDDDDPRHPLVNKAAYSMGGWVGAGTLDKGETFDTLFTACIESGVFEDSRLDSIKREIESGLTDGARHPRQCEDWKSGMIRNKDGAIKLLPDNFLRIFKSHPSMTGVLGYDVRRDVAILVKAPPWETKKSTQYPRDLRDADDVEAAAWVNRLGVHTSAVTQISQALTTAAEDNKIDRVAQWIEELPEWDKLPRVDNWLRRAVGCEDTVYTRAVGKKFLISLIARALRPGCKVDTMPVFIGRQGKLKSTLFRELVSGPGDWAFSDCLGNINKPQDYMPTLMGPWLVEAADLSAFSKREIERVKAFMSTQVDRFRLSYGRRAVDIPRRGCLAGTSNTEEFLTDSENRRFWPVDVQTLDLDVVRKEREQLFAEALAEYRKGSVWWMEGDEVTAAVNAQQDHTATDPWEARIIEYLDTPPLFANVEDETAGKEILKERVTVYELVKDCLQIPSDRVMRAHSQRIGAIMRGLGWARKRGAAEGRNKHRPYIYVRPREW